MKYASLKVISSEYENSKTVGEAKQALQNAGLDFSSFESLVKTADKKLQSLGSHPARMVVQNDLERLIKDNFQPPDQERWEDYGIRYFSND